MSEPSDGRVPPGPDRVVAGTGRPLSGQAHALECLMSRMKRSGEWSL